jgi:hypothetical protein
MTAQATHFEGTGLHRGRSSRASHPLVEGAAIVISSGRGARQDLSQAMCNGASSDYFVGPAGGLENR